MQPEKVLQHKPTVLTDAQRAAYFAGGYLVLPDYVPASWLARLQAATAALLERSRAVSRSDEIFVLEDGHSAAQPTSSAPTSNSITPSST